MPKKKIFIIIAICLSLLILASGAYILFRNDNQSDKFNNRDGRMRQPDFGQPDRTPDVRGVIKSIVGNELTVLEVEMPNRDRNSSSTVEQKDIPKTAVNLSGAGGGPGAGIAGGMGRPGGGELDSNSRAQMLAQMKELSTGEEKIIIPVGIQMLKFDTTGGEREPVEATLADLTADKSITVWLNSSTPEIGTTTGVTSRKIAEFVLIN